MTVIDQACARLDTALLRMEGALADRLEALGTERDGLRSALAAAEAAQRQAELRLAESARADHTASSADGDARRKLAEQLEVSEADRRRLAVQVAAGEAEAKRLHSELEAARSELAALKSAVREAEDSRAALAQLNQQAAHRVDQTIGRLRGLLQS